MKPSELSNEQRFAIARQEFLKKKFLALPMYQQRNLNNLYKLYDFDYKVKGKK